MPIEDTFGYRLVRISLVLLNCLVLVRLLSILLQYSHTVEPTLVLFILLIGANFMAAIIGVIREHRASVILTGSITLIMFLSIIFAAKENKALNFSLLTLLAIAVQSLIFSEMLKERHALSNRRSIGYLATMSRPAPRTSNNSTSSPNLATVVVYQSNNRDRANNLFMIDPSFTSELPKDPPPSYFSSASCPPPKYEDAIKVNACEQSLPMVATTLSGQSQSLHSLPPSFDETSEPSTSEQSSTDTGSKNTFHDQSCATTTGSESTRNDQSNQPSPVDSNHPPPPPPSN